MFFSYTSSLGPLYLLLMWSLLLIRAQFLCLQQQKSFLKILRPFTFNAHVHKHFPRSRFTR